MLQPQSDQSKNQNKKTILLLDDDRKMLKALNDFFSEMIEDSNIITTQTLNEAKNALNKEKIDLIISDYDLGPEKGTDLFVDCFDLMCPVIFLTGHGSGHVIKEIANKHAFCIFEKGVDLNELHATVLDALQVKEDHKQKEKLKYIGQNSATLLHEVNNPLTVILGKIEILKTRLEKKGLGLGDEQIFNDLKSIENNANRLLNLMKKTKSMINGSAHLELKDVMFSEILNQFMEDNKEQFSNENISIELNMGSDFECTVDADSYYQIFSNLLKNSIDVFNETNQKERVIKISSYDFGGSFKNIIFEDNGPGIPADKRNKVFENLYTTKKDSNGTGIGLFACKELAQIHMGDLSLEKDTEIARFILKIPVKRQILQ